MNLKNIIFSNKFIIGLVILLILFFIIYFVVRILYIDSIDGKSFYYVYVIIYDKSGKPISNKKIVIKKQGFEKFNYIDEVNSQYDGTFVFSKLEKGSYLVEWEIDGETINKQIQIEDRNKNIVLSTNTFSFLFIKKPRNYEIFKLNKHFYDFKIFFSKKNYIKKHHIFLYGGKENYKLIDNEALKEKSYYIVKNVNPMDFGGEGDTIKFFAISTNNPSILPNVVPNNNIENFSENVKYISKIYTYSIEFDVKKYKIKDSNLVINNEGGSCDIKLATFYLDDNYIYFQK
jgi:hypothetical protein